MIDMQKERKRFATSSYTTMKMLTCTDPSSPQGFTHYYLNNPCDRHAKALSISAINEIWQKWCWFCRSIVVMEMYGGQQNENTRIPGRFCSNSYPEAEAFCELLKLSNTYGSRYRDKTQVLPHNELTWGSRSVLLKILNDRTLRLNGSWIDFSAAVSSAGDAICDLQSVRNACIHPSKSSLSNLRNRISPRYSIRNQLSHPLDLAYSTHIQSRKIALAYWVDSLNEIATYATR